MDRRCAHLKYMCKLTKLIKYWSFAWCALERTTTSCWRFSLSWKCYARQVRITLWWQISKVFWEFSTPRLLCFFLTFPLSPFLFHPLAVSLLLFCVEFSIDSLPLPVCALNSSNCSFEGQSHKTSLYTGLFDGVVTLYNAQLRNFR